MVDLAAEYVALMQSVTTINIGGEDNPHKVNSINAYKLRGIYDDNQEIFKPTLWNFPLFLPIVQEILHNY